MMTTNGMVISSKLVHKYLESLIGRFYKILPIKESGEDSLNKYLRSFQRELIGCQGVVGALHQDALLLGLISTLQYLIDNECDVDVVRSEVFKAIRLCKKLAEGYVDEAESI